MPLITGEFRISLNIFFCLESLCILYTAWGAKKALLELSPAPLRSSQSCQFASLNSRLCMNKVSLPTHTHTHSHTSPLLKNIYFNRFCICPLELGLEQQCEFFVVSIIFSRKFNYIWVIKYGSVHLRKIKNYYIFAKIFATQLQNPLQALWPQQWGAKRIRPQNIHM